MCGSSKHLSICLAESNHEKLNKAHCYTAQFLGVISSLIKKKKKKCFTLTAKQKGLYMIPQRVSPRLKHISSFRPRSLLTLVEELAQCDGICL